MQSKHLYERGSYREAESKYRQAATLAEQIHGVNSELVFQLKDNIGNVIVCQGQLDAGMRFRQINLRFLLYYILILSSLFSHFYQHFKWDEKSLGRNAW